MESLNSQLTTCLLCFSRGLQVKLNVIDYIKHIRLFHEYHPNFKFICGINGCLRSYQNVGTFKNHVSDAHCDVGSSATAADLEVPFKPLTDSLCSDPIENTLEDTDSSDNDDDYYGGDTAVICQLVLWIHYKNHQPCFYLA